MRHKDLSVALAAAEKEKIYNVVAVADHHVPRCGDLISNQVIQVIMMIFS